MDEPVAEPRPPGPPFTNDRDIVRFRPGMYIGSVRLESLVDALLDPFCNQSRLTRLNVACDADGTLHLSGDAPDIASETLDIILTKLQINWPFAWFAAMA